MSEEFEIEEELEVEESVDIDDDGNIDEEITLLSRKFLKTRKGIFYMEKHSLFFCINPRQIEFFILFYD